MDPNQMEGEMLAEEISTVNGKFCVDCKTTKTPLWRSGPAGPKSLCNACGIRYRKKRACTVGLNRDQDKKKRDCKETSCKKKKVNIGSGKDGKLNEDLKKRLIALGKEVVLLQRQRSPVRRQRNSSISHREFGEVEQAAVLLMALSCGSVFA